MAGDIRGPGWRWPCAAILLVLLVAPSVCHSGLFAGAHGCPAHPDDLRIEAGSVSGRGEILLASGQIARLAWLDTPEDFHESRRVGLVALLADAAALQSHIHLRAGGVRDRWGASGVLADLRLPSGECVSIQEWLLRQGLARLRPETANEPAPTELADWRKAEHDAEEAARGLWGIPEHAPVSASAPDLIRRYEGRFVIVEGVVASVNERASQTYLNFGSRWSEDMTVSAPARIWRMLARSGLTAARLQGGKIRVRGIVESRGGPLIELASPAELEVAGTGSHP